MFSEESSAFANKIQSSSKVGSLAKGNSYRQQDLSFQRSRIPKEFSFGLDMKDPLNRLWIKYFLRTPWFNVDSIGRLYAEFQKIHSSLKISALKVSAAVSDKRRAFFMESEQLNSMKNLFSIRDDEEIIPAENEDSLQKLIDAMKTSQGKCVFFILTKIFPKKSFPFKRLTDVGFAQNRDFLKSWELLSVANGEPFDTRPLVKVM